MANEEKQLLLKDLCARLPYGVIVDPVDCGKAILIGIKDEGLLLFDTICKEEYDKPWNIEYIKPYLRPMSSMTEEEKKEYKDLLYCVKYAVDTVYAVNMLTDWLNAHHFDWRGLINKGLALEAPEGMYKED